MNKKYRYGLGLMSGTSLDGLDIAYCHFSSHESGFDYRVINAITVSYDKTWHNALANAMRLNGRDLIQLHKNYGRFLGKTCLDFLHTYNYRADFIASHGHTVFHEPGKGLNFQLGDGNLVAAICKVPVVCDFRSLDVALGGQGAPLVPAGDRLLFGDYDACINIGGFANVSYEKDNQRIAFDICPANITLNALAREAGQPFDKDGELAAKGKVNTNLLKQLNDLSYYNLPPPKSLGKEWTEQHFNPLLSRSDISTEDKLRTCCEHIAMQTGRSLEEVASGTVLLTGGGTCNKFLVERIKANTRMTIRIPDDTIVNYKEALIFAFLGFLRLNGNINCLKSATSAAEDSSTGSVIIHSNKRTG